MIDKEKLIEFFKQHLALHLNVEHKTVHYGETSLLTVSISLCGVELDSETVTIASKSFDDV